MIMLIIHQIVTLRKVLLLRILLVFQEFLYLPMLKLLLKLLSIIWLIH